MFVDSTVFMRHAKIKQKPRKDNLMSVFDPSVEPMLEVFLFETQTLLDQLDEIMLNSERMGEFDEDAINEIFRIMHTVKGSSAMMGLEGVSALAHHVEDMFFIIREKPESAKSDSSGLFDCVFQSSDFLKNEVDKIQEDISSYEPTDSTSIVNRIKDQVVVLKGGAAPAANTQSAADSAEGAPTEIVNAGINAGIVENMHSVKVFFEDGCQMENIRAFMLLNTIKDLCDHLESDPANPENNSDCASDIIAHGFLVRFTCSGDPQEVYDAIETAVNIKSYEIITEQGGTIVDNPNNQDNISTAEAAPTPDVKSSPAPAKSAPTAAADSGAKKQNLISVNQQKLDQLMDLMGEIVTAEAMVASNPELKGLPLDSFYKATRQLRKLTDELQDVVMSIRMVPLNGLYQKMNRIVRDMSKKLDKDVELVTIGGDTEIDKTIIDSITDPFMHMIRNSMDHGIEPTDVRIANGKPACGKLTLSAQNIGGEIVINIIDDGGGLNAEKLLKKARDNGLLVKPESEYTTNEIYQLIMLPGFSTNEKVTEFSGRGVGMDVVRQNIEKCNGSISVTSEPGQGSSFTIKIPLTLAIVDGMELSVGNAIFTIPITSIKQSFKVTDPSQLLHDVDGNEMIMLRGDCHPIIRLHQKFNFPTEKTNIEDGILLLVESEKKMACIFADELIGEQQVVVKSFPTFFNGYDIKGHGLAGCTILGDGSISLILDANKLLNKG